MLLRPNMTLQQKVTEVSLLAVIANPSQKVIEVVFYGNYDIVKGSSAEVQIYGNKSQTGKVLSVSHPAKEPRTLYLMYRA